MKLSNHEKQALRRTKPEQWTEEELQALTIAEMSRRFEISDGRLRYCINNLGLTRQQALAWQPQGTEPSELERVATEYSISPSTLRTRARKHPKLSLEECAKLDTDRKPRVVKSEKREALKRRSFADNTTRRKGGRPRKTA